MGGGYVTDTGNRLMSDGTYSYEYDAEGNRTKRTKIADNTVDEYRWDYRNRLTQIVSKNAGGSAIETVGYDYDVDDQRVKKTVDGVVENYFIDRDQIAFVTDASGNQTFHYLYGLNVDAVMAQDSPAGMVWALADRLGSIETLTDKDGNVVNKRNFDSFGRILSETNPSVSFRYGYTGRERDLESGLDYYRARYYDPNVGRFISVDPMGFGAGDTNLYRYVGNNSTNATDPSGMIAWSDVQNYAYGGLVNTDKFIAGAADLWTGGYTTKLRNEVYGDKVAGQHEGWQFTAGQLAGFGVSAYLGFKTPNALFSTPLKAIGAAERIAQGYSLVQTGIGAYNTTTKIRNGEMDWSNPLSYLEVAGSFAPAIGFGAKQLGKIGAVQNAISKATSVGENVLSQIQLNSTLSPLRKQYPQIKWNMQGNTMTKEEAKAFVKNVQNNDISREILHRANIDASREGYKINVNIWNRSKNPKTNLADTSMMGGEFVPTYNDNMVQSLIRQYSPVKIFLNDTKTRLSVDLYASRSLKYFQEEVLGRTSGVTIDRATNYTMVHEFTHVRQFLGNKKAKSLGYLPKTVSSEFEAFSNEAKAFSFDLGNKYSLNGDLPYNMQAFIANKRLSPYANRTDYFNDMESELKQYSQY